MLRTYMSEGMKTYLKMSKSTFRHRLMRQDSSHPLLLLYWFIQSQHEVRELGNPVRRVSNECWCCYWATSPRCTGHMSRHLSFTVRLLSNSLTSVARSYPRVRVKLSRRTVQTLCSPSSIYSIYIPSRISSLHQQFFFKVLQCERHGFSYHLAGDYTR